jgi:hypothetical protein
MAIQVTVEFMFPGEGMNIEGAIVTPDTPLAGDEQLDQLPGYTRQRSKVRKLSRTSADDDPAL